MNAVEIAMRNLQSLIRNAPAADRNSTLDVIAAQINEALLQPESSERRCELPDLSDPEDMADQLRERSENIGNALDAAFDRGADAYTRDGEDKAEAARRCFDHPKLQAAFINGWDEAAAYDDDDSFCCSQDPSMRDTHGVPGRDL